MKQKTLPQLKTELDRVFSIYIRTKDADSNGMVKCYTCGTFKHWKQLHCGHYISRRHLSTRFEEKNAKPQCIACNLYNQGNANKFAIHLIEDYGKTILRELDIKMNNKSKIDRFGYEQLINHYKNG